MQIRMTGGKIATTTTAKYSQTCTTSEKKRLFSYSSLIYIKMWPTYPCSILHILEVCEQYKK